jgi:TPR repeat protein
LSKAEYWAQKAADNGDADACALLAQIKITNPVSLDYPQAKTLAEKAAKAGSKAGNLPCADSGQHPGRTHRLPQSHYLAAKRL